MMEAYKTIQGTAQARIEEKKSEFIAHAAFADTEEKALAFLNGIRAKHRTANHNVYAYILRDGARMRYSDDGEPAKTSGLPTLEAIRHAGLVDCIVVTTRYFGGTPVSYTHLDVYKRQRYGRALERRTARGFFQRVCGAYCRRQRLQLCEDVYKRQGYGLSFALCQPQVAQGIKEKAGRVPGFQTVEKGKEVKEKSGEQA